MRRGVADWRREESDPRLLALASALRKAVPPSPVLPPLRGREAMEAAEKAWEEAERERARKRAEAKNPGSSA